MTKREKMFALIGEQEQGKQTISAFCADRDVKIKTFFYWRRKFIASRSGTAGFIPITPPTNVEKTALRLSYPNGVNIHLSGADVSLIAQLIRLV